MCNIFCFLYHIKFELCNNNLCAYAIVKYHNELDLDSAKRMITSIKHKFFNNIRKEQDINKFQSMEHDLLYRYKNQLLCRKSAFETSITIIEQVLKSNIGSNKSKYQILLHGCPGLGKSSFLNALLHDYSIQNNNNNNNKYISILITFSSNSATLLEPNEKNSYRKLYHALIIRIIFKLCLFFLYILYCVNNK